MSPQLPAPSAHEFDQRIAAAIELLAREPRTVTFRFIARKVGLSPSRLAHVFKSEVGLSMREMALRIRVHRAAFRLLEGGQVKEAQFYGGFRHAASLSHCFRRHFGCTPTEFLRMRMGGQEDSGQQARTTECCCDEQTRHLVSPRCESDVSSESRYASRS